MSQEAPPVRKNARGSITRAVVIRKSFPSLSVALNMVTISTKNTLVVHGILPSCMVQKKEYVVAVIIIVVFMMRSTSLRR